MYCSKCGKELGAHQKFCSNCGAFIEHQSAVISVKSYTNPVAKSSERDAAINELNQALGWFSQKKEAYDRYDRIMEQLSKSNHVRKIPMLVWGIIMCTLGSLLIAISIDNNSSGFSLIGILLLLFGPGMIVLFCVFESSRKKSVQTMESNLEKLSNELLDHYLAFGKCSFGMEYSNPDILARIMNLIQSGRADSIKEGINLMISDLKTDEMVELSRITAKNAEIAAREANSAARSSKTSAIFSAASFFLK